MDIIHQWIAMITGFFAAIWRGLRSTALAIYAGFRTFGLVMWHTVLAPARRFARLYPEQKWLLGRIKVATLCGLFYGSFVLLIASVIGFIWDSSHIRNLDYDYAQKLDFEGRFVRVDETVTIDGKEQASKSCSRSALVDVSADLIDFNVNQNKWMPASLAYKLGPFGLAMLNENLIWDNTPWFDNKASFQRGVHDAVASVSIALDENIGRRRGTSAKDEQLSGARNNLFIDKGNWIMGFNPVGFKQYSADSYRAARKQLLAYNERLADCDAVLDARADNLHALLGRMATEIGDTSAVIKRRAEDNNAGWFDVRADNVFREAQGQLYAYMGILKAARHDFRDVIKQRELEAIWDLAEKQLQEAVLLDPLIVSNGAEDGFIMPAHLTSQGFYALRARANLTEMRDVLQK